MMWRDNEHYVWLNYSSVDRYAEASTSFSTDDTIATSGGANVYVRNYNICRKLLELIIDCAG
jgi:hypothetical protein